MTQRAIAERKGEERRGEAGAGREREHQHTTWLRNISFTRADCVETHPLHRHLFISLPFGLLSRLTLARLQIAARVFPSRYTLSSFLAFSSCNLYARSHPLLDGTLSIHRTDQNLHIFIEVAERLFLPWGFQSSLTSAQACSPCSSSTLPCP